MVYECIRPPQEQYVHRHRFESIQHARRVIGERTAFRDNCLSHQALAISMPAGSLWRTVQADATAALQ